MYSARIKSAIMDTASHRHVIKTYINLMQSRRVGKNIRSGTVEMNRKSVTSRVNGRGGYSV